VNAFSDWHSLDADGVGAAPDAPGAVQVSRLDKSLVLYPKGKSAMVFYFYAARSCREALRRLFHDELEAPGAKGQGRLAFRFIEGGEAAQRHLEGLYEAFVERFGAEPVLHAAPTEGDRS
jgi:hypothetical protein